MMQFLSQMLKLPVTAFVVAMEIIARAMREFEKTFDQSVDVVLSGAAQTLANTPGSEADPKDEAGPKDNDPNTSQETGEKEERRMPDQDLSGDDLKLVRYKILFVKRQHEVAFPEQEALVNYKTTGADFAGLKIADFMGEAEKGKYKLDDYPKLKGVAKETDGGWTFKDDDKKNVKIFFEVIARYPKEDVEWPKEQVDVLKEIRDKL